MSLRYARRCLDIAARSNRTTDLGLRPRPLLAGLVLNPCRCYASKPKARSSNDSEEKRSQEDVIRDYEMLQVMSNRLPFDPWAQAIPTMDLMIPSFTSRKKDATLADHFSALTMTARNWFLNAINLRRMADDRAIPGVKVTSSWSWRIMTAQSTSDTAWLAPLRRITLDTYKRINEAVSQRDEKTIKELSIAEMQEHYLKLTRSQDRSRVYTWKFHGERSPCRILSIRSIPAHMGQHVPNGGSRQLVQALVKFDTLQSLEIHSKKGALLHGSSEPKPVVEYLVFQKRMWYDTPWTIRDRLFEGLDSKIENLGTS